LQVVSSDSIKEGGVCALYLGGAITALVALVGWGQGAFYQGP